MIAAIAALAPKVLPVLVAAGAAFDAVFGVFVAAFVVLVVVTMRWAIKRDRAGRAAWVQRQRGIQQTGTPAAAPTRTNGRAPHRRGQRGGGSPSPR